MEWALAILISTITIIGSVCLVGWFEAKQRIKDAQEGAKMMERITNDK